jgi:hypothetical protein
MTNAEFKRRSQIFPLFHADLADASGYRGNGRCSLCEQENDRCFELGSDTEILISCPKCSAEIACEADSWESKRCDNCGKNVAPPKLNDPLTCYTCLRAGKVAFNKRTEVGTFRYGDAMRGMPDLVISEPGTVPMADRTQGEVRFPIASLLELMRTPTYYTMQYERWLFCCGTPMIYMGDWPREKFEEMVEDENVNVILYEDGEAFFKDTVEGDVDGLWEGDLDAGIYVFYCPACDRYRAHWDLD